MVARVRLILFCIVHMFQHVHVHILPRRKGDFGGVTDNVYRELAEHDKPGMEQKFRDAREMQQEAELYRSLLCND